ncbi:hypothetical protein [Capillimicrobium parvum]|uniref:Uncharacterized protein n=1 Tax=Capillimicrobium parvum TaxID=2884022 RepID=A0A9E6Y175_9ACTN|nr:hypothetical protein [Capillimicrobium parvum]UGS38066.1 hypothetical protein DSM104329_04488 [Capillimicrobium parvum]
MAVALAAACALVASASTAEAALVFSREDGTAITFPGKTRVWCGPWEEDVAVPAIHVFAGRLRHPQHHWQLSAVRRDVAPGTRLPFPLDFVFDHPRGAQIFAADMPNEASTAEEEASGSMTFTRTSCRRGGVVAFSIDAVLGSEFIDGEEIHVTGTFRGRVGHAP